ncbi:hypothetical protein [Heyndrickxia acidiproducens]|uniref:hypothetical protein n=1 Tax=Heyndrickxia acidiproducens TaxID=1121084 RepID=UPI001B7FC8FA|nr:hypothetical protein [Heyndrickxia acidiproducens]
MARGKQFNHKRKGHPGEFPKGQIVEAKPIEENAYDNVQIIPHEAFKNRIVEE